MSLTAEFFWALLRAAGIGAAALVLAVPVRALLALRPKGMRPAAWLLVLIPYLTPVLLVGYAYYNFSLSLVHYPFWNAALYSVLLLMKLTPVAALVLHFYPPSLSPEALYCRRLIHHRGTESTENKKTRYERINNIFSVSSVSPWWKYLMFRLRASGRALSVAFALVFLFALGEFEMASLMEIRTWTVKLFDAQVGGLLLRESLWLAILPILFEVGLLAAVLTVLFFGRRPPAASARTRPVPGKCTCIAGWSYLGVSVAVVIAIPLLVILRGTLEGLGILIESFALWRDIEASIFVAAAGAGAAYLVAGLFSGRISSGRGARSTLAWALGLSVPGLLGALLLSLLLLWVFQLPGLRALFNTPVPLIVALALLLLPFAILLRVLLGRLRPGGALHAASLLRASPDPARRGWSRRLTWHMRNRGLFWVAFLLFCWAYFDLTAPALLAPSRMTPVPVRLYNFMHYGQSAVLSASVCAAFAVPFVILLLTLPVRGLLSRLNLYGW